ncbi:MAG: LysM peptidoglycan-binding domain-containing protein [Selenomonas sp.]|nr:LysM peptidoglycan-binding domain-containing protein [Selenomonas sp.]
MKKAIIAMMAVFCLCFVGTNAEAAGKNWNFVEESYTVQHGDTLEGIAEKYMEKNTYGPRELREFIAGIKELNDWLLKRDVAEGDTLRINYWEKKN